MRVLFQYKCGILLSGNGFMEKMKPFFVTKEKGTLSSSQIDKLYLSIKLGEMDIVFPEVMKVLVYIS